jgi:hypothetical protein
MTYRISALAAMLVAGCGEDATATSSPLLASVDAGVSFERDAATPTPIESMRTSDASDGGAFRATWCSNEGRDPGLRLETLARVARGYDGDRAADCHTRGLLPELDALQRRNWWDYLIGYSLLMIGCQPRSTPVPGGILVFGPANTSAIGLPSPRLSRADVERLFDHYVRNLVAFVPLSSVDRLVVERQLRDSAELTIDPNLSDVLSECVLDGGL